MYFFFLLLERSLNEEAIFDLLASGNISDFEDLDDDDPEFDGNVLFRHTADDVSEEEQDGEEISSSEATVPNLPSSPCELPASPNLRTSARESRSTVRELRCSPSTSARSRSPVSSRGRRPLRVRRVASVSSRGRRPLRGRRAASASSRGRRPLSGRRAASVPRVTRKRIWKQTAFTEKAHNYSALPITPVRRPIEYFYDYFDTQFLEKVAHCSNLYYLRTTGHELKSSSTEIAKLFSIHLIMGCIPYPRVPMYWRAGMKLGLISDLMTRDRFLTLRNALHVVESDSPAPNEVNNPLWKVQPMIDRVKEACNKLERVPGFYSIDEQMIPFTGRCKLRQVVKNKPRPVGLKNFVLTTSDGLMLDFEIYKGAKSSFGDTNLGLGPSVILHLVKCVPPGSCVYHDRYFTTIPLIEEMEKMGLHSTGTIMQNRISDRGTLKFKKDTEMQRGESQQFVCDPTAIVKWKDNKSVLLASNCTASEEQSEVKRWDKKQKVYIDVTAPKVVKNYNQYMGGVDVLDQQMEYYRAFIKTKKWTLKVLIHFLDLSAVNAWRLYKNDCSANKIPRKDTMPLLDFRLNLADSLSCVPDRLRPDDYEQNAQVPRRDYKIYRPAIAPSQAKRYDGYEHYPVSDDIKAPRSCRMENCSSRSKIRCEKCDAYLCLSRDKNCFKSYHVKNM